MIAQPPHRAARGARSVAVVVLGTVIAEGWIKDPSLTKSDYVGTIDVVEGGACAFVGVGARIDAGRPGAPEFARELSPHSFGRTFVDETISFTKGCFTGQELVGRLDARDANVPWRLVRVRGRDVTTIDEVIRSAGPQGPAGVTSAVATSAGVIGLAIAHRRLAEQGSPEPDVEVAAVA